MATLKGMQKKHEGKIVKGTIYKQNTPPSGGKPSITKQRGLVGIIMASKVAKKAK